MTAVDQLISKAERALAADDHALTAGLCTQVLSATPNHPAAGLLMARLCLARGREDAARVALDRVDRTALREYLGELSKQPDVSAELAYLGAFVADLEDSLEVGLQLASRAVELNPKTIGLRVLLARLERRAGDLARSYATLQRCAELSTTHSGVQREVSRWLAAAGHPEFALEKYENLLWYSPGDTVARMERWQLRRDLGLNDQYQSEWGQDEYVHRTFFSSHPPGVCVDLRIGATPSYNNTHFFENELGWTAHRIEIPNLREHTGQVFQKVGLDQLDYCAVSVAPDELSTRLLDFGEIAIKVCTIRQPTTELKEHLGRSHYAYDVTVGRDEVWYNAQRIAKAGRQHKLEALA